MRNLLSKIKKLSPKGRVPLNRATFAYLMMLSFILFTAVGAGLVYFPAGFITAGIACGLFGYLLGRE